jgi:hypothetical protein
LDTRRDDGERSAIKFKLPNRAEHLLQKWKKGSDLIWPTMFQVGEDHLDIVDMIEDEVQKRVVVNPPSRTVHRANNPMDRTTLGLAQDSRCITNTRNEIMITFIGVIQAHNRIL